MYNICDEINNELNILAHTQSCKYTFNKSELKENYIKKK